jgi:hypothetical protein
MLVKYCKSIGRILGNISNKVNDEGFLKKVKIFTFTFVAGDLILDILFTAPVVAFLASNGMILAAFYTALGMTTVSLLIAYMTYLYLVPTNERNIIS